MNNGIKEIYYKKLRRLRSRILPEFINIRINPAVFSIKKFMVFAAKNIEDGAKILDAGAGSCPYKEYFHHTIYESTDVGYDFKKPTHKHDFICNLQNIPKPSNTYDAIINTQVLEHVKYPQKVVKEFFRILKPGGKLFLTAPQSWCVHEAPHNYYNFTNFGLKLIFENAGFKTIFIKPMGGLFWDISVRIGAIPHILLQHLNRLQHHKKRFITALLILLPVYLLLLPLCSIIIPLLLFYMDKIDKEKYWTLGYSCYCKKGK